MASASIMLAAIVGVVALLAGALVANFSGDDSPTAGAHLHRAELSRMDSPGDSPMDPRSLKKFVVTSDLFSTESTAPRLRQVVRELLGDREGLRAVWIHDARAGWDEGALARAWLMDGFAELRHLRACGIAHSPGLWINRWKGLGGEFGMQVAERLLEGSYVQPYSDANFSRVAAAIDEASLLYLPGGNPYSLLDALTRNPEGARVWAHARRRIDAGQLVVLTRSAGSIVVGATVDVSTERPAKWRGNDTGLGLAGPLAFIPHFHLPHVNRILHSAKWRASVGRAQWTKEDFLAELVAHGIKGVPLREGWFVAYDGAKRAPDRWTAHQGPQEYRLPRWLCPLVQALEQPYWTFMWHVASVLRSIELKQRSEVATWGHLGSVAVAVFWLLGYMAFLAAITASATSRSWRLGQRAVSNLAKRRTRLRRLVRQASVQTLMSELLRELRRRGELLPGGADSSHGELHQLANELIEELWPLATSLRLQAGAAAPQGAAAPEPEDWPSDVVEQRHVPTTVNGERHLS